VKLIIGGMLLSDSFEHIETVYTCVASKALIQVLCFFRNYYALIRAVNGVFQGPDCLPNPAHSNIHAQPSIILCFVSVSQQMLIKHLESTQCSWTGISTDLETTFDNFEKLFFI